jgi:hypothetical protein
MKAFEFMKEVITEMIEWVKSLECECNSYHGYICKKHDKLSKMEKTLEIIDNVLDIIKINEEIQEKQIGNNKETEDLKLPSDNIVKLGCLREYMKYQFWRFEKFSDDLDKAIYKGDERIFIMIPKSQEYSDYERRIKRIIEKISIVNDIPKDKILKAILEDTCINCGKELPLEDFSYETRCKECNNLMCDECSAMALCQNCYEHYCNDHIELCPKCLENFCFNCIEDHLEEEFHIRLKMKLFKNDLETLPEKTKKIILANIGKNWFIKNEGE